MLERQKGNCFEYSTLLCSLLIAAGYDCYVVSGYATRETCMMDETRDLCPLLKKSDMVATSIYGIEIHTFDSWDVVYKAVLHWLFIPSPSLPLSLSLPHFLPLSSLCLSLSPSLSLSLSLFLPGYLPSTFPLSISPLPSLPLSPLSLSPSPSLNPSSPYLPISLPSLPLPSLPPYNHTSLVPISLSPSFPLSVSPSPPPPPPPALPPYIPPTHYKTLLNII